MFTFGQRGRHLRRRRVGVGAGDRRADLGVDRGAAGVERRLDARLVGIDHSRIGRDADARQGGVGLGRQRAVRALDQVVGGFERGAHLIGGGQRGLERQIGIEGDSADPERLVRRRAAVAAAAAAGGQCQREQRGGQEAIRVQGGRPEFSN